MYLSSTEICCHLFDFTYSIFNLFRKVFGTFGEKVLERVSKTDNVEIGLLRKTFDEQN